MALHLAVVVLEDSVVGVRDHGNLVPGNINVLVGASNRLVEDGPAVFAVVLPERGGALEPDALV